jgi:hypothetical protein
MLFKDPGQMRHEGPGKRITISDQRTGRMLALDPESKTATLITPEQHSYGFPNDMVTEFKKLADGKGEPIGEQQIGGVKAKGFKVMEGGRPVTIWADAKTGTPLRIEMSFNMGDPAMQIVMSDIAFDVELDDSLFSLEPPKDYKLTESKLKVNMDLEENVLTYLRAYAEANEGKFPEKIGDMAEAVKGLKITGDAQGKPDAQTMKVMASVGFIMGTMFSKEKGVDYDYTPGEVKLGDADKIVFWHFDKAKGKYRAVYGDLGAKDVTADTLGAKPRPQPTTR